MAKLWGFTMVNVNKKEDGLNQKNILMYFLLFIFSAFFNLLFFNNYGYTYSIYFSIFIIAIALYVEVDISILALFFFLPFVTVFKFSRNSITIFPILYLIIISKLLFNKIKVPTLSILCIGILFSLQLVCSILYNASLYSIISFMVCLMATICVSHYFLEKSNKKDYVLWASIFFVSGVLLETVASKIFLNIPAIIAPDTYILMVNSGRFVALCEDPNEYSQLVLIALGLIVFLMSSFKNLSLKFFLVIAGVYLGYNGYQTYSKSFVLTLGCLVGIFFLILFFKSMKKMNLKHSNEESGWKKFIFWILIILCMSIGVLIFYDLIIEPVLSKRAAAGSDFLTGRDEIWKRYITGIINRVDLFFIGTGAANHQYIGEKLVAHNLYLEFWAFYGIIGLALLFTLFRGTISNFIHAENKYIFLPIFAFFVTALSLSASANDCLYVILILTSMVKNNSHRDETSIKKS